MALIWWAASQNTTESSHPMKTALRWIWQGGFVYGLQ
jgi:hypothetical protein